MRTIKLNDGDSVEIIKVGQVTIGQLVLPEEPAVKKRKKRNEIKTKRSDS